MRGRWFDTSGFVRLTWTESTQEWNSTTNGQVVWVTKTELTTTINTVDKSQIASKFCMLLREVCIKIMKEAEESKDIAKFICAYKNIIFSQQSINFERLFEDNNSEINLSYAEDYINGELNWKRFNYIRKISDKLKEKYDELISKCDDQSASIYIESIAWENFVYCILPKNMQITDPLCYLDNGIRNSSRIIIFQPQTPCSQRAIMHLNSIYQNNIFTSKVLDKKEVWEKFKWWKINFDSTTHDAWEYIMLGVTWYFSNETMRYRIPENLLN